MPSDLSEEWSASRNSTLIIGINRLRTIPIPQDLILERGGNNEAYRNKFWGKFGCDAIRVVLQARDRDPLHQNQVKQQTTRDDTLRTVTTLLLRIIYSTDWIEHTTNRQIAQQQKHRDTKTVRSTGMKSTNSVGIRSEPISRMTANIRYPTAKSGGESSGILPSIPGYVRYAADRIKMKGS